MILSQISVYRSTTCAACLARPSRLTCCRASVPELPAIDISPFLYNDPDASDAVVENVVESLREFSCVVVRDPRISQEKSDHFIDNMEDYFGRDRHVKLADARPQLSYQVGVTPDFIEVPRCLADPELQKLMASYGEGNKPTTPTGADVKWRFFWKLRSNGSSLPPLDLDTEQVVPAGTTDWARTMDGWGNSLLMTAEAVSEMLALRYGLDRDVFCNMLKDGNHLLAPTGTDLTKHGSLGTVYAGFHYDMNFLTIHGKSRYPGLHIWLRNGKRIPVRVPTGCLLLQAGRQLAWLLGGDIVEGMHEVVCSDDTLNAIERARQGNRPLWRVSSTVFSHVAPDVMLKPVVRGQQASNYQPMSAADYVASELQTIALSRELIQ